MKINEEAESQHSDSQNEVDSMKMMGWRWKMNTVLTLKIKWIQWRLWPGDCLCCLKNRNHVIQHPWSPLSRWGDTRRASIITSNATGEKESGNEEIVNLFGAPPPKSEGNESQSSVTK
jgi:hypothetical protein